jgi:hypothetical protein
MDAIAASEGELGTPDGADCNSAPRFAIDPDPWREFNATGLAPSIDHVAGLRFALQVDQMNGTARVNDGLWL